MAGHVTLTGQHLLTAEQLLADVTSAMEKCNVPYWLEGGTLLGIVRENRLLPWDNDVDLSVHSNEGEGLLRALDELQNMGYRIRVRKFESSSDSFRAGDIRLIKVRKKKFLGLGKSKVCLDIFVKYTMGDEVYWMVNNITKSVPGKYYTELSQVEFKGRHYNVPKHYEDYLSYRYGNWRTPVKQWNTFTDDKALQGN